MTVAASFQFGTKAETLARLRPRVMKSKIPDFHHFTIQEWSLDRERVIHTIAEQLRHNRVIVRSSAIAEDGNHTAMAGAFLSIPDVDMADRENFQRVVDAVIASYENVPSTQNLQNQVLVQCMISDVSMSGVLFTQDLNTGAPFYVINYDDESGRTDTVSSGSCNRTLLVHRDSWKELRSPRFLALIDAVREIEAAIGNDCLDIEFALDKNLCVYIFQVRQITTRAHWNRGITLRVHDALQRLRPFLTARLYPLPGIRGATTVFSRMSDWNPAEMIGTAPRPLALSLYQYLITDRVWRVARRRMGYAEPEGMPLMVALCGQPFIDVRLSFHSFLPADLSASIGDTLVTAWIARLKEHPHLHDKVEFDIATTVLAFDFEKRVSEQFPGVLNEEELAVYRDALQKLTHRLLSGAQASIEEQLKNVETLAEKQRASSRSERGPAIARVAALLDDCIEFGTIPFSILARHAFIANSFLQSFRNCGIFSADDIERFHQTIPTIASELIHDLEQYQRGERTREQFMEHYGHLRPGTYDILSARYDKRSGVIAAAPREQKSAEHAKCEFFLTAVQHRAIQTLLDAYSYHISPEQLILYMKQAIQGREYAKFIFTRNISDALEIMTQWGDAVGLSVEELSYLCIHDILDALVVADGRTLEDYLRQRSEEGRRASEVTKVLRLPHVILSLSDLVIVPLLLHQPNFITHKRVRAPRVVITGADTDPEVIDSKIVVIESADPGFDWIFSRPLAGLITKFGGANSHMAIRCAEFGLPAAIGCGEQIFDRVVRSNVVELNCSEKRIESAAV